RNKYSNVTGAAPRLADGRPDLSGVWNANVDPNPEPAALLPGANDVWRNRLSPSFRDHPMALCLPVIQLRPLRFFTSSFRQGAFWCCSSSTSRTTGRSFSTDASTLNQPNRHGRGIRSQT